MILLVLYLTKTFVVKTLYNCNLLHISAMWHAQHHFWHDSSIWTRLALSCTPPCSFPFYLPHNSVHEDIEQPWGQHTPLPHSLAYKEPAWQPPTSSNTCLTTYGAWIGFISLPFTLYSFSTLHSFSLHTLSYAFSRLTHAIYYHLSVIL